jgi:Tfp pilus assembly protein PilF
MKLFTAYLTCLFLIAAELPYAMAQGEANLINRDYFGDSDLPVQQARSNIQRFHIEPATRAIREGNFSAALGDIDFALRYFPNHPTALQLLGMVAQLQKKPALAIRYYERAVSLFPQYAITQAQYGAYLVAVENVKEGLEKLQKAVEIDPKLAPAHAALAKAYIKAGDMELARQAADQARQLGYKGKIE